MKSFLALYLLLSVTSASRLGTVYAVSTRYFKAQRTRPSITAYIAIFILNLSDGLRKELLPQNAQIYLGLKSGMQIPL